MKTSFARATSPVLAIKPQVFAEAISFQTARSQRGKTFSFSLMASTSRWTKSARTPSVRARRSLDAQHADANRTHGRPASTPAAPTSPRTTSRFRVNRVLSSAGKAWPVEEEQINAVTALSGSGPAYVFHFIDALIRGGIELWPVREALPRPSPSRPSSAPPNSPRNRAALAPRRAALAAQVKSPRGTTLAGCAVLEENDALNKLIARCMSAANNRAEELARGE